ncbi:hypothetical protein HPPC_07640 [Helicobacter pylori PeCan4]|nr:hypothetical protein HPPC_07640 [Helicobacter pylori PeCan4]
MFFNRGVFKDFHVNNSHYAALEKQFQKDKEELEDSGNANAANNKNAKQHYTQITITSINNHVFKVELNADVDNTDWLNSAHTPSVANKWAMLCLLLYPVQLLRKLKDF